MTPRRVKRRSVMTRGTTGRQSTTSRHGGSSNNSGSGNGTTSRQSQRASRRKYHQSTVTKLLEQQQLQQQQQQQQHSKHIPQINHSQSSSQQQQQTITNVFQHNAPSHASAHRRHSTFQRTDNPALTESNLKYLNTDSGHSDPMVAGAGSSNSNNPYGTVAGGALTSAHSNPRYGDIRSAVAQPQQHNQQHHQQQQQAPPPPPDPIYYNMEPPHSAHMQHHSQQIHHQQQQQSHQQLPSHMGHYNPTYQHSNPNLNTMPLDPPPPPDQDLFGQHRPPSVRSSYSNFHGTRHPLAVNSMNGSDTENVFASLTTTTATATGREQQQQQNHHQHQQQVYELQQNMNLPPPPPPLASAVASANSANAAPYLPPRKTASRESIRFLNNGPPAYNLNYHTPPDSETTM